MCYHLATELAALQNKSPSAIQAARITSLHIVSLEIQPTAAGRLAPFAVAVDPNSPHMLLVTRETWRDMCGHGGALRYRT